MGRLELDVSNPGLEQVVGCCEYGDEHADSIICWDCLDSLRNHYVFKEYFVPCS